MGKNDARVVLVVMVVFAKNGGSRQGDKEGDEGRERELDETMYLNRDKDD